MIWLCWRFNGRQCCRCGSWTALSALFAEVFLPGGLDRGST